MTYEQIKDLKPEDFKRACGVHTQTFDKMLAILRDHQKKKVKPGGHRNSPLKINFY